MERRGDCAVEMPTDGDPRRETRWERQHPVVMMSKPPGRPQSAPSKIARKEKGDRERVTLLSENYRRSMDCIDAATVFTTTLEGNSTLTRPSGLRKRSMRRKAMFGTK